MFLAALAPCGCGDEGPGIARIGVSSHFNVGELHNRRMGHEAALRAYMGGVGDHRGFCQNP